MGIDLNGLVPKLVALGFDLASDIQVETVYTHKTASTYSPATGTTSDTTQQDTVDALLLTLTKEELDTDYVEIGDKKIVIQMSEFSNVTDFSQDDYVTVGGVKWQIVRILEEPTGSVFQAFVRRAT